MPKSVFAKPNDN